MTKQEQKIIDRIKKVMAKAEGTNNAAEAEMLMAKVHQMLEEHNVTLLDVSEAELDDPMGKSQGFASCLVNDGWMASLAGAVARYYGCRMIRTKVGKNKWVFSIVGRDSARITVELMTPFIKKQVQSIARDLTKQGEYRNSRIAARRVANALITRVWELVREAERKDDQRVASGERALVPVDLVEQAFHRYYPNVEKGRAATRMTDAVARKAADSVSLHRQTGGTKVKQLA